MGDDAEQEQAERWLQEKSDEEYRRRVEAEREAFAREREAIVLERKKGTGVLVVQKVVARLSNMVVELAAGLGRHIASGRRNHHGRQMIRVVSTVGFRSKLMTAMLQQH